MLVGCDARYSVTNYERERRHARITEDKNEWHIISTPEFCSLSTDSVEKLQNSGVDILMFLGKQLSGLNNLAHIQQILIPTGGGGGGMGGGGGRRPSGGGGGFSFLRFLLCCISCARRHPDCRARWSLLHPSCIDTSGRRLAESATFLKEHVSFGLFSRLQSEKVVVS